MSGKQNIRDIPPEKLPAVVKELGLKPFAAGQIIEWLYKKGAASFEEMTNLSKDARALLSRDFFIGRLELIKTLESSDGTKKFAWKLSDGNVIESVLIPSEPYSKVPDLGTKALRHLGTRLTLCISTQVGCAMGCSFCRTAGMGFVRNLTQGEIVGQILAATREACHPEPEGRRISRTRFNAGDSSAASRPQNDKHRITNVVLMGMGEPLANYDNVVNALRIMIDTKCLNLSRRHVTLSTSGLIPGIERLAKEGLDIKLAISLNATTDEEREKIMPVNKKYPLEKLLSALKAYSRATKRSRMTFEYVMMDGFNDSNDDAKRLVKYLSHFPSKVNLIPLNPCYACHSRESGNPVNARNSRFCGGDRAPSEATVQRFAQFLRNKHVQVNIRSSRGQDILAACGQLASKHPA